MGAIQTVRRGLQGLDELGDAIRDPYSGGPVREAVGEAGRNYCNWYGNVQDGVAALGGPGRSTTDLVCRPYFEDGGYNPPVIGPPPLPGGQCAGLIYRPSGTFVRSCSTTGLPAGSVGTWTAGGDCIGPITGIGINASGGAWAVQHAGANDVFLSYDEGSGNIQNIPRAGVTCGQATTSTKVRSASETPKITAINPIGHTDDCGNLPGELVPGAIPPPLPTPFPPGESPGVDAEGQPFFYVPPIDNPGFDPVPLDDEPFGGAPASETGAPAGGDGLPGDPDAIGDEAGEVTGEEDGQDVEFGTPPEGRVWIGCIVQTTTDSRIGNIPGTAPRGTVWPSVRANVALIYGSQLGKTERINSRFHDLFRPNTSLIVTGCFIQVQPGSTSKIFPVSALKCPENPCGTSNG